MSQGKSTLIKPSFFLLSVHNRREGTSVLKSSASTKCKSYTCLIHIPTVVPDSLLKEISSKVDLEITQKNPTRVPRRANLERQKIIHSLHLTAFTETCPEAIAYFQDKKGRRDADFG